MSRKLNVFVNFALMTIGFTLVLTSFFNDDPIRSMDLEITGLLYVVLGTLFMILDGITDIFDIHHKLLRIAIDQAKAQELSRYEFQEKENKSELDKSV